MFNSLAPRPVLVGLALQNHQENPERERETLQHITITLTDYLNN